MIRKNRSAALQAVKKVFPQATFARYVDECHCKQDLQIFWMDKPQSPDNDGYLQGGFYCQSCGFGNAGKCHISALLR